MDHFGCVGLEAQELVKVCPCRWLSMCSRGRQSRRCGQLPRTGRVVLQRAQGANNGGSVAAAAALGPFKCKLLSLRLRFVNDVYLFVHDILNVSLYQLRYKPFVNNFC